MEYPDTFIQAIETVVPEQRYSQAFALEKMIELVGNTESQRNFLSRIYPKSGIENRYSVIEDYAKPYAENRFFPKTPDYRPEPTTAARNQAFVEAAEPLTQAVVDKLFDHYGWLDPQRITHLITVSCTGFSTPGFDFHLVKVLKLSAQIHRFHIGFMGCFAAFPALKLARDICRSSPSAQVLIVNCELCSVHIKFLFDLDLQVANAIFSDGVSATIVSCDTPYIGTSAIALDQFFAKTIPDSENEMSWEIGDFGFEMKLTNRVPAILRQNMPTLIHDILLRSGLPQIDHWAVHPGGTTILNKFIESMALPPQALAHSFEVLKNYGNMSSATIFFVLKQFLSEPGEGPLFAVAFGPGLTVESGVFRLVSG